MSPVQKVEVLGDGAVLQTLDAAALAARLQPAGMRDSTSHAAKSTHALLFLNVILAPGAVVPRELSHRVAILASAAPPDRQNMSETGGATSVDRQPVVQVGPPLRGAGDISADSCCDATRHTRAAMPIDGRVWLAQRFAVDWEKLNAGGTIYSGPRAEKLGATPSSVSPPSQSRTLSSHPSSMDSPNRLPENIPRVFLWPMPTETA